MGLGSKQIWIENLPSYFRASNLCQFYFTTLNLGSLIFKIEKNIIHQKKMHCKEDFLNSLCFLLNVIQLLLLFGKPQKSKQKQNFMSRNFRKYKELQSVFPLNLRKLFVLSSLMSLVIHGCQRLIECNSKVYY